MKRIYIAAGLLSLLALMPWLLGQSSYGSWRNWAIYTASSDTVGIDPNSDGTAECTFGVLGAAAPFGGSLDCGGNDAAAGSLKLYEDSTNGSNTVTVTAPANIASDVGCTMDDDSTPMDSCISYSETMRIVEPGVDLLAASHDTFWFKAPTALAIYNVECIIESGTSIEVDVQQCASDGTACADIDSTPTLCDGDGAASDGSLDNASVSTNDWIRVALGTNTGNAQDLTLQVRFTKGAIP